MGDTSVRELSCAAKLARIVLANCGPLSPSEVAEEAYISRARANIGLEELAAEGHAEAVCGMCSVREEVYALTEDTEQANPRA